MENISKQISSFNITDSNNSNKTSVVYSFIKAIVAIVILLVLFRWIEELFLKKTYASQTTKHINNPFLKKTVPLMLFFPPAPAIFFLHPPIIAKNNKKDNPIVTFNFIINGFYKIGH
jgi:NADH:ubiquinone oxidoreductase subunit 5 (subunit L)/multisubunit Na+/H+ antiporter MnhA subunit